MKKIETGDHMFLKSDYKIQNYLYSKMQIFLKKIPFIKRFIKFALFIGVSLENKIIQMKGEINVF